MRAILASCQELLFPSYCLECGLRLPFKRLPLLCDNCTGNIPIIHPPHCTICGLPFDCGENHVCGKCLKRKPAFALARAAMAYQPPIISLISTLKFKGQLTSLATLAQLAALSPGLRELSVPDLIIPVPLHKNRLRERGFNQALLIARACFPESKNLISSEILIRNRATLPQTQLHRPERRRNISGAFSIIQPQRVTNRRILLIDDVLTTGSTAHECSRILYCGGAERVEVFTLARAIQPDYPRAPLRGITS